MRRPITALIFLFVLTQATGLRAQSGPYDATPQRPTFTSDTSTTAPGTVEIEFGASATGSGGGFLVLPTMLKFTPDVSAGVFRAAEFSVSFDALQHDSSGADTESRFGDFVLLAVRRPVWEGDSFSVAVAPLAQFYLWGQKGARLGLLGILAYSSGLEALVANFTWTSATSSSPTNPAHKYDFALDYGHTLGPAGTASRVGVFAGILTERPTHADTLVSMSQGITYRMRPNLVWDLAIVENGLAAGPLGYQVVAGLTVNLGRLVR